MVTSAPSSAVLAFVFTDIEGSTALWERTPDAMQAALAQHDKVLRETFSSHDGTVFKTVGDAFCCAFARPQNAVRAAVAIQRRLHGENWPAETGELRVRIGVHSGSALPAEGDYFGPTVNRTARLMAAAHGGQIVVSAATALLVRESLATEFQFKNLGFFRLKDLSEPETIFQVVADGLDTDFGHLATLDARPNNLPSQISTFIGREREMQTLRQALTSHRLVTVTGTGGIGKTRLALQLAAEATGQFENGCWFVPLAALLDPSLIHHSVASVLQIQEQGSNLPEDAIVRFLREKHVLIVLDNAEHLLQDVAKTVRRLLAACPRLSLLVTSRERLHVKGEQIVRLEPMPVAPNETSAHDLPRYEATRLFIERAMLTTEGNEISHSDALHITSICAKVEGIPLAIELAAARADTLGVAAIDERLQPNFDLLASKDTSESERHQTLAKTIEWSYRLLATEQQRFFARLSVFEGGFALDACEYVLQDSESTATTIDLLDALIDKSFVGFRTESGSRRHYLLEPLRSFAARSIEQADHLSKLRERHFQFYSALVNRPDTSRTPEDESRYLSTIEREMPNIRAALSWGLEQQDQVSGMELLVAVSRYWQIHGHITEGRLWFDRFIGTFNGTSDKHLMAAIQRRAATFATMQDDYNAARRLSERCLSLYRDLSDESGVAEGTHNLAVIEQRAGNLQKAFDLYASSLEIFRGANHLRGIVTTLTNQGMILMQNGALDEARRCFEESAATCRESGDIDALGSVLCKCGSLEIACNELERGERLYAEALKIKRELSSHTDTAEILTQLAGINLRKGSHSSALLLAKQAMTVALEIDSKAEALTSFEMFAAIFARSGEAAEAVTALQCADDLRAETNYSMAPLFAADLEALRASVPQRHSPAALPQADWRSHAEILVRGPRPA